LWSMVEHSAWLERYPDGESQHCVPLQCAQKVCIHGLIQYKQGLKKGVFRVQPDDYGWQQDEYKLDKWIHCSLFRPY